MSERMKSVSDYLFRIVDYRVTDGGYLFRVATKGMGDIKYNFVYIPFGRYASVLMLDFYLARPAGKDSINHQLVNAVRQDLAGYDDVIVLGDKSGTSKGKMVESNEGFVVREGGGKAFHRLVEVDRINKAKDSYKLDITQADYNSERAGKVVDSLLSGIYDMTREGFLIDPKDEGHRVHDNNWMKIIRNVSMTRNMYKNLNKLRADKIAFRVNEQGLIIDYVERGERVDERDVEIYKLEQGAHISSRDTKKFDSLKASKILSRELAVNNLKDAKKILTRTTYLEDFLQAERIKNVELSLMFNHLLAVRNFKVSAEVSRGFSGLAVRDEEPRHMVIHNSDLPFYRDIESKAVVDKGALLGKRDNISEINVITGDLGLRTDLFNISILRGEQGVRTNSFESFVYRTHKLGQLDFNREMSFLEHWMAKLKVRQYPTINHKLNYAERVTGDRLTPKDGHLPDRWQLFLTRLGKSDRINEDNLGNVFRLQQSQRIYNTNEGYVVSQNQAIRHNTWDGNIIRQILQAQRDNIVDLDVLQGLLKAYRDSIANLNIMASNPKAERIYIVRGYINSLRYEGERKNSQEASKLEGDIEAHRLMTYKADVVNEHPLAHRINKEQADIITKYLLGKRVDKVETYINKRYYTEGGKAPKRMLLPKTRLQGHRTDTAYVDILEHGKQGSRSVEYEIFLPKEVVKGTRSLSKDMYLEEELYSAFKTRKNLMIDSTIVEAIKGTKRLTVEKVLKAIRRIDKAMFLMSDPLAKGAFKGSYVWEGVLLEDEIVGEILNDVAIIDEIQIHAEGDPDSDEYNSWVMDGEFLHGVKRRIDALYECGVLVSERDGDSEGLLTLNFEGIKNDLKGVIDIETSEGLKEGKGGTTDTEYSLGRKDVKDAETDIAYSLGDKTPKDSAVVESNIHGHKSSRDSLESVDIPQADLERPDKIVHLPDDIMQGSKPYRQGELEIDDPLGYINARPTDFLPADVLAEIEEKRQEGIIMEVKSPGARGEKHGQSRESLIGYTHLRKGTSDRNSLMSHLISREGINNQHLTGATQYRFALVGVDLLAKSIIRYGEKDLEYDFGELLLNQTHFSADYTVAHPTERKSVTSIDYTLGHSVLRDTFLNEDYTISTKNDDEGFISYEYSIGTKPEFRAVTDLEYSLASPSERQLFTSDEYTLGSKHEQESIIMDLVFTGGNSSRDSYILTDHHEGFVEMREAILSSNVVQGIIKKEPCGSMIETIHGRIERAGEIIGLQFSTKGGRNGYFTNDLFGIKEKFGSVAESFVFSRSEKSSYIHDYIVGVEEKSSELIESLFGSKDYRYSFITSTVYGNKGIRLAHEHRLIDGLKVEKPQFSFGDEVTLAEKGNKDGVFESTLNFSKWYRFSYVNADWLMEKEKWGESYESVVADKDFRDAYVTDTVFGNKGFRDSLVTNTVFGMKGERNTFISLSILSSKDYTYSDSSESLLARKGERESYNTLSVIADKNYLDTFITYSTIAGKDFLDSHVTYSLVIDKEVRDSRLTENILTDKAYKESSLTQSILADKGFRGSFLVESVLSNKGFRESYLTTSVTGIKGEKGSYVTESTLSYKEFKDTRLTNNIVAGKWGKSTFISDSVIGSKDERFTYSLEDVLASKGLRESYIKDTLEAVKDTKHSIIDTEQLGVKSFRESLVSRDLQAESSEFNSVIDLTINADKLAHLSYSNQVDDFGKVMRDSSLFESLLSKSLERQSLVLEDTLSELRASETHLINSTLADKLGYSSFVGQDLWAQGTYRESYDFGSYFTGIREFSESALLNERLLMDKVEKASFDSGTEVAGGELAPTGTGLEEFYLGFKDVKPFDIHNSISALENTKTATKDFLLVGLNLSQYADISYTYEGYNFAQYATLNHSLEGSNAEQYSTMQTLIVGGNLEYASCIEYSNFGSEIPKSVLVGWENTATEEIKQSFTKEDLTATSSSYSSTISEALQGGQVTSATYVIEISFAYNQENISFLHDSDVAINEKMAHIEDSLMGINEKLAHVPQGIQGEHLTDIAMLSGEVLGTTEPTESRVFYELLGSNTENPATLDIEFTFGTKEPSPSVMELEFTFGSKEPRVSSVDIEFTLGTQDLKTSVKDNTYDVGSKKLIDSDVTIEFTYGAKEQRDGILDTERTYGDLILKNGVLDIDWSVGDKLGLNGVLDLEWNRGEKLEYSSWLNEKYTPAKGDQLRPGENPQVSTPATPANARLSHMEPDDVMASWKERVAFIVSGFVFGHTEEQRATFLKELTALLPLRTAHLMEEFHKAKSEKPADLIETGLADKPQHGEVIEQLMADKPQQGEMSEIQLGQGFLFDYNDDLLYEGMDVEEWSTGYGYGVPENYNPHDPFNAYYPYTVSLNSYEMTQLVDWRPVEGTWEIEENGNTIKLTGQKGKSMMIADVKSSNYKLSTKFRVMGDEDKAVSFIFKYFDSENYHVFKIHGGDSNRSLGMVSPMQLYRVRNGVPTAIGSPMNPFQWKKGTWHTVNISVIETDYKIVIAVDGKLQYDLKETY